VTRYYEAVNHAIKNYCGESMQVIRIIT
jgi:hypothetical protein